MKNLAIGWFFQDLNPGGGQRFCREISKILAGRGHHITIVVPRGRALVEVPDAEIIEAGPEFKNPILAISASLPAMKKAMGKKDVVISSMPFMGILNRFCSTRLKYHFLQSDDFTLFDDRNLIRSSTLLNFYKMTAKISYRLPLKYWCNSRWTLEKFKGHSPAVDPTIVHPGVDIEVFKPPPTNCRQPGLIGVFLKHGRIRALHTVVEVMNRLAEHGFKLKLRVFSKDDFDFHNCRCEVEKLYIANDESLVKKMNECALFIGASYDEGFYLPGLEAMACGLPLVMTDCGGCRDYAVHNLNCLLLPPGDSQKMSEAVIELLTNPAKACLLAETGVADAAKFTWNATADRIEAIIEKDWAEL